MFNSKICGEKNLITHDAIQKIPPIIRKVYQMSSLAPQS